MAWGWLQATATAAATSSTVATTPAANLTSGSTMLAVACVSNFPSSTCTSVKDAALNSFVAIKSTGWTNGTEVSLWALNTPAGDAGAKPAITATFSAAIGASAIIVVEFSGIVTGTTLAALADGTPGSLMGVAGASTGSATYSSTALNRLLVSVYGDDGGPETWVLPTGYTNDNNGGTLKGFNTNSNANLEIAFRNSTNGVEASSWALSGTSAQWGVITVAFKLAAAAVPIPNLVMGPMR